MESTTRGAVLADPHDQRKPMTVDAQLCHRCVTEPDGASHQYFSLAALVDQGLPKVAHLPEGIRPLPGHPSTSISLSQGAIAR